MFRKAVLAAVLCALGTSSHAGAPATLGQKATVTGGEYTTGGGLTVAVETRQIGDKLGLCGVWAQSDSMSAYTRRAAPRILARGVATLNGQVIVRDLGFLNRVSPSASYAGAPANCIVLNRSWSPQDGHARLDVRIPRQKVLTTATGQNGLPRIFFTRSDSANPALSTGALLPSSITSFSLN